MIAKQKLRSQDIKEATQAELEIVRVNSIRAGAYLCAIPEYLFNCIRAIEVVLDKRYAHVISEVIVDGETVNFSNTNESFFSGLQDVLNRLNALMTQLYSNDEAHELILSEMLNVRFEYKFQVLGIFQNLSIHPTEAAKKIKWVASTVDSIMESSMDPNMTVLDYLDAYESPSEFLDDYPDFTDKYSLINKLMNDSAACGYKIKLAYKAAKGLISGEKETNESIDKIIILNRSIARKITRQILVGTGNYSEDNIRNFADSAIYNAAHRYSKKEFQFTTILPRRIQAEVNAENAASTVNLIHIPDSEARRTKEIKLYTDEFINIHGRKPNTDELRERFPRTRDLKISPANQFVGIFSPHDNGNDDHTMELNPMFSEAIDSVYSSSIASVEQSVLAEELQEKITNAFKIIHKNHGEKMVNFIHAYKMQDLSRAEVMQTCGISSDVYRAMRNSIESILTETFAIVGIDATDLSTIVNG